MRSYCLTSFAPKTRQRSTSDHRDCWRTGPPDSKGLSSAFISAHGPKSVITDRSTPCANLAAIEPCGRHLEVDDDEAGDLTGLLTAWAVQFGRKTFTKLGIWRCKWNAEPSGSISTALSSPTRRSAVSRALASELSSAKKDYSRTRTCRLSFRNVPPAFERGNCVCAQSLMTSIGATEDRPSLSTARRCSRFSSRATGSGSCNAGRSGHIDAASDVDALASHETRPV